MVEGKGINDMPKGWRLENEKNRRIYKTWSNMLCRCYSKKYHEKRPTYKNCNVCDRWLLLSNFIKDFKLIDGYDEEKFLNGELELDKDIKSNGQNKEYSLENCILVNQSENTKQAIKTRDNNYLHKSHTEETKRKISEAIKGKGVKIAQYDKKHRLIKIWNCSMDIQRELNICQNNIILCCKWYECGENLETWHKSHKGYPYKSCGGFIWKYYKEDNKN